MLKHEFPDSKITYKDLPIFLFKLAGYDFAPDAFQIIQKPSKFGGIWKEVQSIGKQINEQLQTSLF